MSFWMVEWFVNSSYSSMQQSMRFIIRQFAAVICAGLMALALAGCGHGPSAADKPAAKIQGDLINPGASAAAQPVSTPTPAPVSAVAVAKTAEPKTGTGGEYSAVGFDKLASYNFDVPDDGPVTNLTAGPDKADEQIPTAVKAFNRKKVSIKGFMLPLKVENGSVTEFLILKDQSMCCYGNVPKITEWVSVKTAGKGVKPIMDVPVSIEGTLHVGAMRENGYLVGIYQMDGDKMVGGN
jgi:hypothetical protein